MPRPPVLPLVATLVLGCADVGTSDDTNPFGDGTTAASGQGTVAPDPTGGETSTATAGETAAATTAEATTAEATTTAEASTSGPPPGTDDATTVPGDTSGGTGAGELGECVGIGAWTSCAQYCEAVLDVCVEGGCGGSTVVYYGDVNDCTAMAAGSGEATACDAAFMGGGGASFARCCCQ